MIPNMIFSRIFFYKINSFIKKMPYKLSWWKNSVTGVISEAYGSNFFLISLVAEILFDYINWENWLLLLVFFPQLLLLFNWLKWWKTRNKGNICLLLPTGDSLVAQMVKHLPARQETQVRSLRHEDPLEKGMAAHSSILAWRIPWTEEPGRLQSMGSQKSDMTERLTLSTGTFTLFSSRRAAQVLQCLETLREKPAGAVSFPGLTVQWWFLLPSAWGWGVGGGVKRTHHGRQQESLGQQVICLATGQFIFSSCST